MNKGILLTKIANAGTTSFFTFLLFGSFMLLLGACTGGVKPSLSDSVAETAQPDVEAMHSLEGIWLDAETEQVVVRIEGDSIFYPDSLSMPARFAIFEDTLVVYTSDEVRYPLLQREENLIEYVSLSGESIRLYRSENPDDSLVFSPRQYAPILLNEAVKRDTIQLSPTGERYHLYINVNPTRYRVHKTTYTPEGLPVDNVYFDNLIHVSVYKGRNSVFSHDFIKSDFQKLIPEQFLEGAILSNMEFGTADKEGCHFHATLCHPDGASCYVVNILVGYDGSHSLNLLGY